MIQAEASEKSRCLQEPVAQYAQVSNGGATLEFKSIGCPGYINVEVAGTKFARTLPPAVHELENAWEWAD